MERRHPNKREDPSSRTEESNGVQEKNVTEDTQEVRRPSMVPSPSHPSSLARPSVRQYIFIDQQGDRRSSNEAVRVHVMRESHRAKRQLRGLRQSGGQQILDDMTIMQAPRGLHLLGRAATEEVRFDTDADDGRTIANDLAMSNARSLTDLRRLAGHYTAKLSASQRNALELCQYSAAALSAFLAVAVLQYPGIGTDTPQITSAELESQALVTVRSHLQNSRKADHDDTSLTIALLSRLEVSTSLRQRRNNDIADFHDAALQHMIQSTGGILALRERNAALAQVLQSLRHEQVEN